MYGQAKAGERVEGGFVFKDVRTSVKTSMARAKVDEVFRDLILGHSLQGMDAYYLKPTEADLKEAMDQYTRWIDEEAESAVSHQMSHQRAGSEGEGGS